MGSLFPDGFIVIGSQTVKSRIKMTKGMQLTGARSREMEDGTWGTK